VLTFDDGPWPENTPDVLKALADNCLKATFFEIGVARSMSLAYGFLAKSLCDQV
jgi:peptidoglycan/xylan/chitin deacetylase (PgdA/CDA1 family)